MDLARPLRALIVLLVGGGSLLVPSTAHAVDAVPGSISGTVTLGTTTTPNTGGFVSLYQQDEAGVWQQYSDSWGTTDEDGRYSFEVPAGTYRVRFWGPIHYRTEYWDNTTTVEGARDLTITAGQDTSHVDAVLDQTEVLPGTIPVISGSRRVGAVLTATSDTWTPATVTRTRQWFRNGVAIASAVGPTYTTGASDLGASLSVQITASSGAMTPASATSVPTIRLGLGGLHLTSSAAVTGTTAVGRWLLAVPPTTSPASTATYQWLRNGTAIKGATKVRYQQTSVDKGKKIGVQITVARAGYKPVVRVVTRSATAG